ncbi:hypothetical protein AMECASPLE_024904, partial [Ameca splendens]
VQSRSIQKTYSYNCRKRWFDKPLTQVLSAGAKRKTKSYQHISCCSCRWDLVWRHCASPVKTLTVRDPVWL